MSLIEIYDKAIVAMEQRAADLEFMIKRRQRRLDELARELAGLQSEFAGVLKSIDEMKEPRDELALASG